jgi:formate hydrogenlyase subunit 3/multisubunit Na+/H+ antiporter MnhD subunit
MFALGLSMILCGGIAALILAHRPAAAGLAFRGLVAAGCLLGVIPAVVALFGAPAAASGGSFPFGIDALSAWFLLLPLGVGAAIALYGVSYLLGGHDERRAGAAHLLLSVLIVSMAGVIAARTIVAFLVSWEIMAIAAYFLVIFEHREPGVGRAGMIYMVLTHLSTLLLISMFACWTGGASGWRFEDLALASSRATVPAALPLVLGLIAFGIKAGAVPFHFWLPGAHAAAPSHVSALLSGVMLKVGIYGLFRILTITGAPPAWWGWTVLLVGLASAILGVLWALAQHDLKRLLAYHSVENIGIILMGLGLGALGSAYHQPAVALLGYAGALLHTLNHALFKSLLFLGAGAVARATGTREIDRLGGLAPRMPRTALLFLVGSVAIVGLPPLNGFVSEWLIFMGLLGSGFTSGDLRIASVTAAGLALTGGLALACFAKLYGVAFLGRPRDAGLAWRTPEIPGLLLPQWMLAGGCVLVGVAPVLVLPAVARVAARLPGPAARLGEALPAIPDALPLTILSAVLLGLVAVLWAIRRATAAARPRETAPTWGCAFSAATGRMQYTASSTAAPLLGLFGPLSGNHIERAPGSLRTHPRDLVVDVLGRPAWKRITDAAADLRVLQSGGIRGYLIYLILCMLGLLVYLRFLAPR